MKRKKISPRKIRHERIRKKLFGHSQRPRLCVLRSLKNMSAQIIDDSIGKTLVSVSTFDKEAKSRIKYGGNVKAAEELGRLMAEKAKAKGITTVIFDRSGYQYHGRVKIFAETARKGGLVF